MEALPTSISPSDSRFEANSRHHRALAEELHERQNRIRQGGGEKYRQRNEAQGKLALTDVEAKEFKRPILKRHETEEGSYYSSTRL